MRSSRFHWISTEDGTDLSLEGFRYRFSLSIRSSFSKIRDYVNLILIGCLPSLVKSLNSYGFLVFSTRQCDGCTCISEEALRTHIESWNTFVYITTPAPLPEPLRGSDGPVLFWLGLLPRKRLQGSLSLDAFRRSFARRFRPFQTSRKKPSHSTSLLPARSEMTVP